MKKRANQPRREDGGRQKEKRSRIFLVDNHPIVRLGLRTLIDSQGDMEVCGEAGDAPAATEAIVETKPDAAIIDIALGVGHGLELIKDLRSVLPRLRMVILTMHDEEVYGSRALRAGAVAYIMKSQPVAKVAHALREVLAGGFYLSDAMIEHMISQQIEGVRGAGVNPVSTLTDREMETFQMIGNWKSTREIADSLHLAVKTVEYYREQIKKKLGLKTASELLQAATTWALEERVRKVADRR